MPEMKERNKIKPKKKEGVKEVKVTKPLPVAKKEVLDTSKWPTTPPAPSLNGVTLYQGRN